MLASSCKGVLWSGHQCKVAASNSWSLLLCPDPKGSPSLKKVGSIWALPKWGGGLDPCPNGLGHLILRRIVHVQRGICLVWGVWTLARMVWGTCAVKIEVQMAFAQVGPEIKCPRVPVWVRGGGQSLFGQCPNRPDIFQTGASLINYFTNSLARCVFVAMVPVGNRNGWFGNSNFCTLRVTNQPTGISCGQYNWTTLKKVRCIYRGSHGMWMCIEENTNT